MSDALEHCYGAPHHCNGEGYCSCDCRACEKLTPLYRAFWCREHPGKRHVHQGQWDADYTLTGWTCVDG